MKVKIILSNKIVGKINIYMLPLNFSTFKGYFNVFNFIFQDQNFQKELDSLTRDLSTLFCWKNNLIIDKEKSNI